MFDHDKDNIKYNSARWYGKIRYPYLCYNWKQHYRGGGSQKICLHKVTIRFWEETSFHSDKEYIFDSHF